MERKRKIRLLAASAAALALCAGGVGAWALRGGGHDGPPQKDRVIDAAGRKAVVDAIVDNITRSYVYPDKAAQMSARLRAQAQHGDFDRITSSIELADALTESLRHDTHDRHLATNDTLNERVCQRASHSTTYRA